MKVMGKVKGMNFQCGEGGGGGGGEGGEGELVLVLVAERVAVIVNALMLPRQGTFLVNALPPLKKAPTKRRTKTKGGRRTPPHPLCIHLLRPLV